MNNESLNKIYFNPGDVVVLKHSVITSPIMYVVEKVTSSFYKETGKDKLFIGIRCRWFDKTLNLREAIFSSKDLIFYNGENI